MKKILLLDKYRNKIFSNWEQSSKEKGVTLFCAHYDDLSFHFLEKKVKIFVKKIPLENFKLIYFRTKFGYEEEVSLLASWAKRKKIKVADRILEKSPYIDRKSFEYCSLSLNKVPFIESYGARGEKILEFGDYLSYPLVLKETDKERGEGVFLIKNREQFQQIVEAKKNQFFIVQKFIENDGDIRAFVVGNKVVAAMKRQRSSKTDFRNNVSQGGTTNCVSLDKNSQQLAVKAAQSMDYDVAGVDLIYDPERKKYVVMEVNCGPQFGGLSKACGINIPAVILQYLKKKA